MSYGTGAIFGVPAHDQRDLDFANKLNLPIKLVVESKNIEDNKITNIAYTGDGKIVNSRFFRWYDYKRSKSAYN